MADEAGVDISANITNNGSNSTRTTEESGDEYEVEKIIGMCKTKGKTMYKVRWVGFDSSWDTWEPAENLESCIDVIQAYVHQKKQQKKEEVKTKKVSVTESLDKDVFSQEESSRDGSVASCNTTGSSDTKKKKTAWKYVSSSDDEADTLKDKFWRDLEQGKVDVFQNDMYSKVKGEGTRTSRPESFKDMYKTKPLVQEGTTSEPLKKKRKSGERKSTDTLSSVESETDTVKQKRISGERKSTESTGSVEVIKKKVKKSSSENSAKVKTKSVDLIKADGNSSKKKSAGISNVSSVLDQSVQGNLEEVRNAKRKEKKEKALSVGKGSSSKKGNVNVVSQIDQGNVEVKKELVMEEKPDTVVVQEIKTEPLDTSLDETSQTDVIMPSSASPKVLPDGSIDTLKDTFWRDLDEGKLNVFSADMYSKVKSCGRAARPKSFSERPKEKPTISPSWKPSMEAPKKTRISSDLKKNLSKKSAKHRGVDKTSDESVLKKEDPSRVLPQQVVTDDGCQSDDFSATMPGYREDSIPDLKVKETRSTVRKDSIESVASSLDDLQPPVLMSQIRVDTKQTENQEHAVNQVDRLTEVQGNFQKDSLTVAAEQMVVVGECTSNATVLWEQADPKLFKCKVLLQRIPPLQYTTSHTTRTLCEGKLHAADAHQTKRKVAKKKVGPKNPRNKERQPVTVGDKVVDEKTDSFGKVVVPKKIGHNQSSRGCTDSQVVCETSSISNHGDVTVTPKSRLGSGGAIDAPRCVSSAVSDDRSCKSEASSFAASITDSAKKRDVKTTKRKRKLSSSCEKKSAIVSSSKKGRLFISGSDTENVEEKGKTGQDIGDSMDVMKDTNPSRIAVNTQKSCFSEGLDDFMENESSSKDQQLPPQMLTGPGISASCNRGAGGEFSSSQIDEVALGSPLTGPHSNYSVQSCDSGVDISHERSFGLNTSVASTSSSTEVVKESSESTGFGDLRKQQTGRYPATEMGGCENKQLDFIDFDFELDPTLQQNVKPASSFEHTADLNTVELRHAIKKNEFDRVRLALTRRKYDLEQADSTGVTLTMYCALRGYDDMLELLVKNGANVNAETKNGATALIMACDQGLRCTVELLLLLGAYVNKATSNSGETPLIKSVKRGHIHIVRSLLNEGCNFSSPSSEHNAVKFAKAYNQVEIMHLLNDHIHRVTTEMESQVLVTLNNTAEIVKQLFGVQSLALREASKFKISFKHELEPTQQGIGMLLFIAHARVSATEVKCRFYGPCAVTSAYLNGTKLHPLTDDGNFVMSFCPLHNGRNDLEINTVAAPTSKAKLVICGYKAKLNNNAS